VFIAVGAHEDNQWLNRFGIRTIRRHYDYTSNNFHHDFALIELDGTATIDENVRPVCQPSLDVDEGWKAVTTGWGTGEYLCIRCECYKAVALHGELFE
jgi:secreted trypsin-like serine protease